MRTHFDDDTKLEDHWLFETDLDNGWTLRVILLDYDDHFNLIVPEYQSITMSAMVSLHKRIAHTIQVFGPPVVGDEIEWPTGKDRIVKRTFHPEQKFIEFGIYPVW